jgi:ElaB/YqjD/DUF883 family membrane-anchored ribosome-binding protein
MADTTRSEQNQPKQAAKLPGETPQPGSGQTTEQTASTARQARESEQQTGQTGQMRQSAKERASEMTGLAREKINKAYTRTRRGMNETWGQAMGYSKDHPAAATLVAFGAGIGVGLVIAGSFGGFHSRSRTRRLVPKVMNAISEITRVFFR